MKFSSIVRLALVVVFISMMALVAGNQPASTVDAQEGSTLVIYSGRSENLVGPFIEQFEEDTGINVEVRYGDTAELALQILEEGENSPADVFFAQDAGALGAVSKAGLLTELPTDIMDLVDPRFSAEDGTWVGITGRARVFVYNPELISPEELPASIMDFTDAEWAGKIGWAPTNGSFQAFVTAMRVTAGDEVAQAWVEGILANEPMVYPNNSSIVEATANGEIIGGFVNHYYLYRFLAENPDFAATNYYFPEGDLGSMINVAGAGILASSENQILAQRFILYSLSLRGQQYFVDNTAEYPLLQYGEFELPEGLVDLETFLVPDLDLGDLDDLQATLEMLEATGALTAE